MQFLCNNLTKPRQAALANELYEEQLLFALNIMRPQ